ncbi:replication initiation protein [Helicobacter pylori]|uniref:replication initiation protein n=1 Tax=Helicobacter pylori TaxID=210 RepID=UPI0027120951|nr:replication initiation protein [Helicobacter pylori]MDO7812476.1 replication initiation protein [Helicobacter pylori]
MPRVNNEPKTKRPKKFKRPTVKKSQKYLITQDNRLIYAKYGDITANEIKVFYYIVSKLNSISDKGFEVCEIPINEILGEVLEHENMDNHYTYIKKLCESLLGRYFIDETLSIDPTTNKAVDSFKGMPMFKILEYTKGEATIKYQLNEYLKPYLLGLKRSFTQIPLRNIVPINSGYAIRIYQMLLSELKQNRNKIEMGLLYLQDVLCVPKSMYIFGSFKQKILDPSFEEINATTEIVADYRPLKEGKKIVKLEFEIAFKKREEREKQYKKRTIHQLGVRIIKPLEKIKGKTLDHMVNGETKEITYMGNFTINEDRQEVIAVFEEMPKRNTYTLTIKTPEDIEKLKIMQKQHAYRRTSKNKKLILADKDGSGLVFREQIKENLKKRKEEAKTIENNKAVNAEKIKNGTFFKDNQEIESMKKTLGGLFSNNMQKDPPNP